MERILNEKCKIVHHFLETMSVINFLVMRWRIAITLIACFVIALCIVLRTAVGITVLQKMV